MLQLRNTSPFAAAFFAIPDGDGVDSLFVVVRATFCLGAEGVRIADEQQPVARADRHRGEPGRSSLVATSEAHLIKPGTDVVVLGDACAPDETPVTEVEVGLGIADRQKHARVHGERYWTEGLGGLRPSRAKPFVRTPVIWEHAFGGRQVIDEGHGTFLAEPRNPVGRGFVAKGSPAKLLGQPAPGIEDLRVPIGAPGTRGTPVGFGPIAPAWQPRRQHGGTYDDAWRKTRAPYLPDDFDPRFFNVAPPDLVFLDPLRGGEPVALRGFHPRGVQRFDLPACDLRIEVSVAKQRQTLPHRIDLVVLEPTEERFSLSWRAALRVDKSMLRIEEVRVSLQGIEGILQPSRSA